MFDLSKLIKRLRNNPLYLIITVFVLVLIVILGAIYLKNKNRASGSAQITQDQIELERGGDIVIINKNGLVEYRTKDKVFFETWDTSRMNSFFDLMQTRARQRVNKQATNNCYYKVTMYLDGKLVTFCSDENDTEVKQVYDTYDEKIEPSLSDLYSSNPGDNGGDNNQGDLSNIVYFPTPTQAGVSATPTPHQTSGGSQTNFPPVKADCDTWSKSIVNSRAIISNTYCTVQPTPTPAI